MVSRRYSNPSTRIKCSAHSSEKLFQTAPPLAEVSTSEAAFVTMKELKVGISGQAWKKPLRHFTICNTTWRDKTHLLVQAVPVGTRDTAWEASYLTGV